MEPQQTDIIKGIIELRESLKIFEQKLLQLKDSLTVIDQNTIERYNELKEAIQTISKQVNENKNRILELDDQISRLNNELTQFAKERDLKVIEKYLSFIDPSRFLSKDDVIKIVDEYISEKKWG